MLLRSNSPHIDFSGIPGRHTGYYTFSSVRYSQVSEPTAPVVICFQYGPTRASNVWSHLDDRCPQHEPVWVEVQPSDFKWRPMMADRIPVVSEGLLKRMQTLQLDPTLHVFPCRVCRKGKEVAPPFQYFGIYGPQRPGHWDGLPEDINPETVQGMTHDYMIRYLQPDQPELGRYDMFIEPTMAVVYSEKLANLMIEAEPLLQFDPVMTLG